MLFSSITFIYIFLPIICTIYFLIKKEYRNIVLFIASILLYIWNEPIYYGIMLLIIVINYFGALLIDKNRTKFNIILVFTINLLFLIFFKYFNFLIEDINFLFQLNKGFFKIIIPIGISLYIFFAMSYIFSVYLNEINLENDNQKFSLFKCFDFFTIFKVIKSKSIVDLIFILIFFVLLYIPIIKLDTKSLFDSFGYDLNTFPSLFSSKYHLNYKFGEEFEDVFYDRFYKKNSFIYFFINLKYKLHRKYCEIRSSYIYKDTGWMFFYQEKKHYYDILTPLDDYIITRYTNKIKFLLDYAKENNIKVYITIVPSKEFIYQEEDEYHPNFEHENVDVLVNKIKKELGYDIIYPIEEFRKLKKDKLLYYKTDHHLTNTGSYELYKIITKRVNKDFKDIHVTPLSEFNLFYNNLVRPDEKRDFGKGGNIYREHLNDDKTLLKQKYEYYDYKKLDSITIKENFPYGEHINPKGKYKVLIIGDSMIETLTFFLDTNYNKIVKYRNPTVDYKAFIEKEKPDIFFIIYSAGGI